MALGRKTGGRQKGTPNKATPEKRAFWKAFLEQNEGTAQELFDALRATDPKAALDVLLKASPYVYPQLGRLEHTGEGGGAITFTIIPDKDG